MLALNANRLLGKRNGITFFIKNSQKLFEFLVPDGFDHHLRLYAGGGPC